MTAPAARRWTQPGWRTAAEEWITTILGGAGVRVTGPVRTERVRCWSVHLTVPTDAGRYWFKENCPAQAFEAGLVGDLRGIVGDRILEVAATHPQQGWLLTPDQGPDLRDAGLGRDVATCERLMIDYGQLQRVLLRADLDLTAHLTAMDPALAPDYLEEAVTRLVGLPAEDPGRLDEDTAARLRALGPQIRRWADTVLATGLPLTLDHADLHLGNAFAAVGSGSVRIFDFSDAVLAFPLCSLLVPIRVFGWADGDSAFGPATIARLVDCYLEQFSDLVPMAELRAAVPAALELAKLNRHESWRRALDGADAESYAEFGDAPAAWLGMIERPARPSPASG